MAYIFGRHFLNFGHSVNCFIKPQISHFERLFLVRLSSSSKVPKTYNLFHKLDHWEHEVHPYGRLLVNVPFNVNIVPIDPIALPYQDKATMTLFANPNADGEIYKEKWKEFYKATTHTRLHEKEMDFVASLTELGKKAFNENGGGMLECLIEVPIKFSVNVHTSENGNVNITGLESHSVNVTTQHGECFLSNLKCGSVHAHSWSGNIVCLEGILSNVDLGTKGTGMIKANKLQGEHIRLKTESGHIQVKTLYSETANIWTQTGKTNLGSTHGNNIIDVKKGDVQIESLDGSLSACIDKGNLEAHLSRHEQVLIRVAEGDICLLLPDESSSMLELEGNDVLVEMDLPVHVESRERHGDRVFFKGRLNDGEVGNIVAMTKNGKVKLESQDWFTSLKMSL